MRVGLGPMPPAGWHRASQGSPYVPRTDVVLCLERLRFLQLRLFVFLPQWAASLTRTDKAEWAGGFAICLSGRGAEPTHEASAEPPLRLSESTPSLFERCRA